MDKEFILTEIKRIAAENDGAPPGKRTFENLTGIKESYWVGRYWARWSDAVSEAGYVPNKRQEAYGELRLLTNLRDAIGAIGTWPSTADLRLHRRNHPGFPNDKTLRRLGSRSELARALLANRSELELSSAIVALCEAVVAESATDPDAVETTSETKGFVYLLKSGRYHKIGRANDPSRRAYELRILLPEKASVIHQIETDDPAGIEAYWHRRFSDRRANGEWFLLAAADVAAFKARKTM